VTEYKLNHFTMADAQALAGKTADITEWDDDELERKVIYPGAESPASSSFQPVPGDRDRRSRDQRRRDRGTPGDPAARARAAPVLHLDLRGR
jgi:hypothetical protein